MHASKPTPVSIIKGNGFENFYIPRVNMKLIKGIWYHMFQLLEAYWMEKIELTLTQFLYPGCFGNIQSSYRSLEWS
jgi:hypothetical protein